MDRPEEKLRTERKRVGGEGCIKGSKIGGSVQTGSKMRGNQFWRKKGKTPWKGDEEKRENVRKGIGIGGEGEILSGEK